MIPNLSDLFLGDREKLRDNRQNNFGDKGEVECFRDNEGTSWFFINYDRFALFFTFPFFAPYRPCSVIARYIFAYHHQSV